VTPHIDVLCDIEIGEKRWFLVDNGDTSISGLSRIMKFNLFAANSDDASIGTMDTSQDFDQGAFARAVFANESVHFAGVQVEVYVA